ncbi:hypothetical protein [Lacticaseibacillus yichunensis]|uniref:Uncharacterized protein n=1 Tax=Lacticaseibacillus yichunensis TaxID=2486015 RepID=A0ABW4CPR9_9LACO|nr:hypothetical protein [Lacticaseibacillus yichunensis]
MDKRLAKKLLKQQASKVQYFYGTFTDGSTVELPVRTKPGNTKAYDDLMTKIRTKTGSLTAGEGHKFEFRDLVHYEFSDTRR